jgi:hypothetical protein
MMTLNEINMILADIAEQHLQERIEDEYDLFMEEMYYNLQCDQWERDMELFNEFY